VTIVDRRMAAELMLLARARVPTCAVRITIRDRLTAQIAAGPMGARSVVEAVERALRTAREVAQELVEPGDLVETVYFASLEAVRGHGGESAQWIAEATRCAHAVLNEMAAGGVEATWTRHIRQAEGWEGE